MRYQGRARGGGFGVTTPSIELQSVICGKKSDSPFENLNKMGKNNKKYEKPKEKKTPNYIIIILCTRTYTSCAPLSREPAAVVVDTPRAVPIIITMRVRTEALKTLKSITGRRIHITV